MSLPSKFIVFFLLFLPLAGPVAAQTPYLKQHNLIKGRRDYKTNVIFQDGQGTIWFGTTHGIIRYDGQNYELFTTRDGLTENDVTTITQDRDGLLWIGHKKGSISIFNGHSFTAFEPESGLGSIPVTGMMFDDAGVLWFGTYGEGVYYYSDRMHIIGHDEGLSDNNVYCIEPGDSGEVWIGTDYGVNVVSKESDSILHISMRNGLPDNIIKDIKRLDDGDFIFATDEAGLVRYHPGNQEFETYGEWDFGSINNMALAGKSIWISTARNGVVQLRFNDDGTHTYETLSEQHGLSSDRTETVFIDREKNAWIGTANGVTQAISPIFEFLNEHNDPAFNMIYGFLIDENDFYWVCNQDGLYKLTRLESGGFEAKKLFADGVYSNVHFISLYEDSENYIWAGTYDYGVFRINPATLEFRAYSTAQGLANENVISISGKGSRIYFSTLGGGVSECDIKNKPLKFKNYSEASRISSNYVYSTFTDSRNRTWIGGASNNLCMVSDTGISTFSEEDSLFASSFYQFTEDHNNNIWFTTDDNGVYRYTGKKFINYNESNGLRTSDVTGIITDDYGNIVLVSNEGIDLYQPANGNFTRFGENYGVAYKNPVNNVVYKDRHGRIWIGTNSGLIEYNPDQMFADTIEPRIFISDIWLGLEPVPKGRHKFRHNENRFQFEWTGLWFQDPDQLVYRHRLEGYDMKWSSPGTARDDQYSKVPPGTYTFSVEVSIDNTNWIGSEEATYDFIIRPPFWQRWWFITLSIVATLILIYLIFRARLAALRRAKDKLEEEVRKATREILEKNEELESQKSEIESQRDLVMEQRDRIAQQQQELQASIRYALRIQTAVLTPDNEISRLLDNYFILNLPRDIVSGDFYWVDNKAEGIFFSVADSTGHGVPGAFMSMLGISAFNEVLSSYDGYCANEFLFNLRERVKQALHHSDREKETADGMDAAMCIYNRKTATLSMSGANNPVYLIRDGALQEFKCDKMPIGLHFRDQDPFVEHTIKVKKGDCVYLFSDGYADQFGGENGKKFKYKPFKEKLLEIHKLPVSEQKKILYETIVQWKGSYEQIDDILVMGVQF